MAWGALAVTHFLAAALMFLLAGWLLWLNFESRINRAFALFLVLRGMASVANRLAELVPGAHALWQAIAGYVLLGATLALGHFLATYTSRDRGWRHRAAVAALLAGAVLVEGLYLADHCLLGCSGPDGRLALGPLSLVTFGLTMLYAVAGLVLARESVRAAQPARRAAASLVATAFLLQAVLEAAIVLGLVLVRGPAALAADHVPNAWFVLAYALRAGALLAAAAGLWVLCGPAARAVAPARNARTMACLALAAVASGIYQAAAPILWPGLALSATLLTGLWLLLLPVLATFALVRHRLFGLDVKVRWTISKGPLAFALLATFFVGAQLAQNYLSAAYGWVGGGVLAGLLLFAANPLQKMGERLAEGVARTRPLAALTHGERVDLYRAQATLAWSDGSLARKERLLLDSLRERLGLTADDAVRVEREALSTPPSA
ncbi:MAG TPA: hypothetical protein VM241_09260 [Candidatus Thermoplasmatota archaeon]|nr:hypothetical protein [Candidatus Thermoplasmatota archaeon]